VAAPISRSRIAEPGPHVFEYLQPRYARSADEECCLTLLQLRARRLDEQIIRTVAVSVDGLLAQLRLLSAFYEESANGAGRRGSLLIQSIAAGIERLVSTARCDRDDSGPYIN